EDQFFVSVRISREPETSIDVLAISLNCWKLVLLCFRNTLAFCLHDLQILIVYPDATLKESLFGLLRIGHDFRLYIEDIKIELVDLFFTGVTNVVPAYLRRLQRKGFDTAEVFNVFVRHFRQRRHREEADLLVAV